METARSSSGSLPPPWNRPTFCFLFFFPHYLLALYSFFFFPLSRSLLPDPLLVPYSSSFFASAAAPEEYVPRQILRLAGPYSSALYLHSFLSSSPRRPLRPAPFSVFSPSPCASHCVGSERKHTHPPCGCCCCSSSSTPTPAHVMQSKNE